MCYNGVMLEKDLQRHVLGLMRSSGWRVCHFNDSRRQVKPGVFVGDVDARGFPDVVAVKHGRVLFVEFKSEKGVVSRFQAEWLESLQVAGMEVFVWRPSHLDSGAVYKVLGKKCWGEFYGSWGC